MAITHAHDELTGISPETVDAKFLAQHLSAYAFARRLVGGKRVLEIGFGDGYGADYLAQSAAEVVGVDMTAANIPRARARYPRPNLRFEQTGGGPLAFPDGAFDAVVAFQVIEHIPEPQLPAFLAEIRRVMAPGGLCCLSTLNLAHNMKPGRPYQKLSCHEKEFTGPELESLLRTAFARVEMRGLYLTPGHELMQRLKKWGLERWGPPARNPVARFYQRVSVGDFMVRPLTASALDLFAVCRTA
jgi:SAM-dependent methyltransferase